MRHVLKFSCFKNVYQPQDVQREENKLVWKKKRENKMEGKKESIFSLPFAESTKEVKFTRQEWYEGNFM